MEKQAKKSLYLGFITTGVSSDPYFNPIAKVLKNTDGHISFKQLSSERIKCEFEKQILKYSSSSTYCNFKLSRLSKETITYLEHLANDYQIFALYINEGYIREHVDKPGFFYDGDIPIEDIQVYSEKSKQLNSEDEIVVNGKTTELIRIDGNTIGLNTILCGPPGTGKTYNAVKYAVGIIEPKTLINGEKYKTIKEKYDKYVSEGRIKFATFHQSYGYEEFIEGIKPQLEEEKTIENCKAAVESVNTNENCDAISESATNRSNTDNLKYKIESGVFKDFCNKAKEDKDNNYVFIIDEINRGNISKIFGELITLIDSNKRGGADEQMSATLPYSKETFSVPKNVYILGTMNTADRSIALIDTALRRRFSFIEMMPNPELLKDIKVKKDSKEIDIELVLKTINKRIEILYDREHTIGHAFFMKLKQNNSIEVLADIFKTNIIPLLQEYFYEDYEKIQWILGDNNKDKEDTMKFIKGEDIKQDVFFDTVRHGKEKKFSINAGALTEPCSYVYIYEVKS